MSTNIEIQKEHPEKTLGKSALASLLSHFYFVPKLPALCVQISASSMTCAQNNASQGPRPNPGVLTIGTLPFEDLEVHFTEVKPYRGYKYFLVVVYTYSGWAEAYPICSEWAREVAKAL